MTRVLTTKGAGQPDFTRTVANMDSVQRRLGSIDQRLRGTLPIRVMAGTVESIVGTISYMRRLGTITRMGTLGYVSYIPRIGSIGSMPISPTRGTLSYVKRLGTIGEGGGRGTVGYVRRLGTLGEGGGRGTIAYVRRIGTVGRMGTTQVNIAAQDVMVGVDVQARFLSPVTMRDRVPLGPGTAWLGSWQHVGSYNAFRFGVVSRGGGGSLAIVGGAVGTGADGGVGTIYGADQVMGSILDMFPPPSAERIVRYARPWFRRTGNTRGTVSAFLLRRA